MISLFFRGWLQVALVAWNTGQIAHGQFGPAFVVGFAISAVWWRNAHSAGHDDIRGGWFAYALGAACGTVTGMVVGNLIRS